MTTREKLLFEYEGEAPLRVSGSSVAEREQRLVSYAPRRRRTRKRGHEETQRRIDEFLVLMSHELRTPITTVKANVQIALKQAQNMVMRREQAATQVEPEGRVPGDGDLMKMRALQQALERSELAVNRLTRLVDDLLNAARTGLDKLD